MCNIKGILVIPDKLNDIYAFDSIISLEKEIYVKSIHTLDMSSVSFIEPYSMTNLLLIARRYLKNTGNRLKLTQIPLPIHQYLTRMNFFKYPVFDEPEPLDSKKMLSRSTLSKRILEITEIPNLERESVRVISQAVSLFRRRGAYILKHWFCPDTVNYFVTVISEVCQNVFEHSMDSGFLALQTYTYNRENVVRLVIADSGIGIEESFSAEQKRTYGTGSALIKNALTAPISGKREFGYGLCRVNSIIKEMKGNLFIRSDRSSVAFVYNKGYSDNAYSFLKDDLEPFSGTQISISLYG
ncbi:MAG: ATP-binding protein [Spirochaetes bacterium]|nr:ATP-binding protein [Spirochaetota bacterium]MBN2772102.1 ATP-binding protein [Spirochaetota bacterium]